MKELYRRNRHFLDAFEHRLVDVLDEQRRTTGGPEVLFDAMDHLACAKGAKRMRPLLVDHVGRACGLEEDSRLAVAVSAELIHTASLLHDDLVDGADRRRCKPSVNARWNNAVAVLGGDLSLCVAFEQLDGLPRQIVDDAVALVGEMTRGVMAEIKARKTRRWDIDDWESIAAGKTAALLAWCTTSAVTAAGDSNRRARMRVLGHQLGMAFQLMDDLNDLEPGGELEDLRDANPSYPIAWVRTHVDEVADELQRLWSADDADVERHRRLAERMMATGVVGHTRRRIDGHLDAAMQALGDWSGRPGGRQIAAWADRLRDLAIPDG